MRKAKGARWLDRRIAAPGPYLALCLSEQAFANATAHAGIVQPGDWIKTPWSQATTHYFDGERGFIVIICMRDWEGRDPIEVAGLLVHEAVHVWQEYAARIGERNPGVEQEAYAVQAVAQELMAEFARQTQC